MTPNQPEANEHDLDALAASERWILGWAAVRNAIANTIWEEFHRYDVGEVAEQINRAMDVLKEEELD